MHPMKPADSTSPDYFLLGFPLSDDAWTRFDVAGSVQTAGFDPARTIRLLAGGFAPATGPAAEELLALRTLNAIMRWVSRRYFEVENPGSLDRARDRASARLGSAGLERLFNAFVSLFPPVPVRPGGESPETFLTQRLPGRGPDPATVEMLLLYWLTQAFDVPLPGGS